MFDVLGLGEKQSSPMSTRVLVTLSPFTLSESKPSVFLGRACREPSQSGFLFMARNIITEALVENALMKTLSKETSLVRTKKFVQHGEFSWVMPSTLTRVALSVKNKIGR
jgi:hypothetical protein